MNKDKFKTIKSLKKRRNCKNILIEKFNLNNLVNLN